MQHGDVIDISAVWEVKYETQGWHEDMTKYSPIICRKGVIELGDRDVYAWG